MNKTETRHVINPVSNQEDEDNKWQSVLDEQERLDPGLHGKKKDQDLPPKKGPAPKQAPPIPKDETTPEPRPLVKHEPKHLPPKQTKGTKYHEDDDMPKDGLVKYIPVQEGTPTPVGYSHRVVGHRFDPVDGVQLLINALGLLINMPLSVFMVANPEHGLAYYHHNGISYEDLPTDLQQFIHESEVAHAHHIQEMTTSHVANINGTVEATQATTHQENMVTFEQPTSGIPDDDGDDSHGGNDDEDDDGSDSEHESNPSDEAPPARGKAKSSTTTTTPQQHAHIIAALS